jgi:hypothetical protein
MRHLLDVWRLRQLLGHNAAERVENSLSLQDGKVSPDLLESPPAG